MNIFYQKFSNCVAYFFILLFFYASISKILDFENFQVQLAQSPLLSAFAESISYMVILTEVVISGLLSVPKTRKFGLYASFGLMVAFTVYIYLILNYSDFIPCSCGGILEKMSWQTHFIFNIACIVLSLSSIIFLKIVDKTAWKDVIITTMIIFLINTGGIISLFISSENLIKNNNNFTRRYPQHPVLEEARINLKVNSYYFAGFDDQNLFLGNSTSPLLVTSYNQTFASTKQKYIHLNKGDLFSPSLRLKVKAPHYYLFDGSVPVIYRGSLKSMLIKSMNYKASYFNQFSIIDSVHFAVRSIITNPKHFALGLINQKGPVFFKSQDSILPKKVQSLFETDGSLVQDPLNQDAIYVYRYQSKFAVVDGNLKQYTEFRTIDGTPFSQLDIKTMKNGDKHFQSPPPQVNKKTTIFGGVLFIESNKMGKFESRKRWNEASVIDMYSTNQKEYFGSFYINHPKSTKLTEILVTEKFLFVILGNELVRYSLNESITKHFKKGSAENLKKSRQ
jgi:hypothetical protein